MTSEPRSARVSAACACEPAWSRGRRYVETESATRTPFQRDRDRILHSAAFRRLKHKTQVFVYHEGDHFRTRLTHSLEVAQIARSISRVLGLNEDLAETLALAHDLGHPPFGHAGEDALAAAMGPFGGFDHNAQTLRVVTLLERRYAEFDGLNLTWETLEGIVKHNGPLTGPHAPRDAEGLVIAVPETLQQYVEEHDLELDTHASAEAQVAALADDIAYQNHDVDDGLRAGLFEIEALRSIPLAGPVIAEVEARYPQLELSRLIHESVRRMIDRMVTDVIAESRRRLERLAPRSADDVRALSTPVIAMSDALAAENRALREFLFVNMYRHYKVNRMTGKGRRIVGDLFQHYLSDPDCLPTVWRAKSNGPRTVETARLVCDFVAGMTDRFAAIEHARLFDIYRNI
jgi:dGTPase